MNEGGSVLEQYNISHADLTIGIVLGEGSFGTVHKGEMVRGSGASRSKFKRASSAGPLALSSAMFTMDTLAEEEEEGDTFTVAIKTVRATKVSQITIQAFMREITISKLLNCAQRYSIVRASFENTCNSRVWSIAVAPLQHKNLVALYGASWKDGADKLCIVLEYCSNGSLHDLLQVHGDGRSLAEDANADGSTPIMWKSVFRVIITGIVACFKYLHHDIGGEPLLHRDLKPANVLITHRRRAKVRILVFHTTYPLYRRVWPESFPPEH